MKTYNVGCVQSDVEFEIIIPQTVTAIWFLNSKGLDLGPFDN